MEASLVRCLLVLTVAAIPLCTAQDPATTTFNLTSDPVYTNWTCNGNGLKTRFRTDVRTIIQTIIQTTAETMYSPTCQLCGANNPSNAVLNANTNPTLVRQYGGIGGGSPGMVTIGNVAYQLTTTSNGSPIEHALIVYNMSTDYSLLPQFYLSTIVERGPGITVCASYGYIYISDVVTKTIQVYSSKTGSRVNVWSVDFQGYLGGDILTADANCNLVAAGVGSPSTLGIFTYDGTVSTRVPLTEPRGIRMVQSAVKTPAGYFVAYNDGDNIPRVGFFDTTGALVTQATFGFNSATCIVVNGGYVLVADPDGARVVMLDTSLTYVSTLVNTYVNHLWLDTVNSLLFVAPSINPYSAVFIKIYSV